MKNRMLFVLLFAGVTACQAQFETGKKVIGGQFGIQVYHADNPTTPPGNTQRSGNFSASLSLSHFKSPTLLNGFGFNYNYNRNDYNIGNPASEQTDYNHTIGIFINSMRLQPLARKFYLTYTGTAGAGYGFSKTSFTSSSSYTQGKNYNVYLSGALGLLYQLHSRFLLTTDLSNLIRLSYTHSDLATHFATGVNKGTSNSVGLSSGLSGFSLNSLSVGVRYLLK